MAAFGLLLQSYFYFYISICLLFFTPISYSLSESDALLKLKQSFTKPERLSSWVVGSQPCAKNVQWVGLICSNNGFVTGLRLGDMGLSGKIDVLALKEIKGLRSISFVNNAFSGPIPEFNILGALRGIFLSGNQFSGEIPSEYFANMQSLKKLWISDNKFTGKIPTSLAKLNNLIELHLENNQFNGIIPTLNIVSLTSIDLSNNKLEGEIPTTLSKFDASSFDGNVGLCGGKLGKECPKLLVPMNQPTTEQTEPSKKNDKSRNAQDNLSKIIVAASIIGGLVVISLVVFIIFKSKRKDDEEKKCDKFGRKNGDDVKVEVTVAPVENNKGVDTGPMRRSRNNSSHRSNQRKGGGGCGGGSGVGELMIVNDEKGVFGLQDLMKASAEVLGNGSIGWSYKARMANGLAVVVKRTPAMNTKAKEDFDAHMRMLGRLKHVNVLTPLAYHYRKNEKLLVCEHVPKGSLLYVLHGNRGQGQVKLNWPTRLKIVQGIAKGLGFLHSNLASIDVPHGNLKSSNILLGSDCEPLLSDFGHSPFVSSEHKTQALFAYRTPEALQSISVSPKNDVYCLGIVILEILTGKFPSQYLNNGQGGTDIVQWVASAISEGREVELLDTEIENASKNAQAEMGKLIHISAACTESNPELRLDMMEAIRRIEEIQV